MKQIHLVLAAVALMSALTGCVSAVEDAEPAGSDCPWRCADQCCSSDQVCNESAKRCETLAITLDVPSEPTNADGKSSALIEAKILRGDAPESTGSVRFASDLEGSSFGEIEGSSLARTSDVSASAGSAYARLYSRKSGTARLTATWRDESGKSVTARAQVAFDADPAMVGSIRFLAADPPALLTKGSGSRESSRVSFQVLDKSNAPLADAKVIFELQGPDPGEAILEPMVARSGSDGVVATNLLAGAEPGSVVVAAYNASRSVSAPSRAIAISRLPNHRNFSFECEHRAIAGFHSTGLTMRCFAHLADRQGLKVVGHPVHFLTEAGAIDQVATTDETGTAVAVYKTQEPMPADVDPELAFMPPFLESSGPVEPGQPCPDDQTKVCNPRDGLVTIVAYATGEEEWLDDDQDGQWDEGESWTDLPEPFVDANDDRLFDPGDSYADVSQKNGSFDTVNGRFDSVTQIWKETKIVWTGDVDPGPSGFYDGDTRQKLSTLTVEHCGRPRGLFVLIVDSNLNSLAALDGDSMRCDCERGRCFAEPEHFELDDDRSGFKFVPAHALRVTDTHVCSPDCHASSPPCEPAMGILLTCTGTFTTAEGGPSIEASTSIDTTVY